MRRLWRLAPTIALATAVALLLAGLAMSIYGERAYQADKIDQVQVEARILASTVTAAVMFRDHKAAQEYVDALDANPDVEAAMVYDAQGALFAGYVRSGGRAPPATAPPAGARFAGDRLSVAVPVRQAGKPLGTVYLQTLTEPLARRLERYGVIILLVTMAALIVGVLGLAHAALGRANRELESRARALGAANDSLQAQIAEREKAEAALRQAQKMEAIGQLTGGVAHDFNNLLQVIMGNLDLVRRRTVPAGQNGRMVEAAVRAAERAATLTQRLLAFSRRQPLAPRSLDLNELVAGMSDLLYRTLGEAIRVAPVLAGGIWRVFADANQLENALLNLAVNARDAMPEGGTLTIETANAVLDEHAALGQEEVRPGDYVVIAVTDTGTGMTRDVLAKAFDPFFTTKDIGKGSGLGLSQVYGFMRQSGGHVRIHSEPGRGTTVRLYLPRLAESAAPAAAKAQAAPTACSSHERLLVVEDDADVRAYSVETLRELGYDVVEAADGATALRLLEATPGIRLLFTDVGLPGGMNGRQLAEAARRRRPGLKVLFTTGYARDALSQDGRLDPGVELIGKPFTYAALADKIRRTLEGEGGATPPR